MSAPPFALDQLDPELAGKIQARFGTLPRVKLQLMRPLLVWGACGGLLSALTSILLTSEKPDSFLGLFLGLLVMGVFAAIGFRQSAAAQKQLNRSISGTDLRTIVSQLDLTRSEHEYLLAVASLLESKELLGEEPARELLAEVNNLLACERHLEAQRRQLSAAVGAGSVGELASEEAALRERLNACGDPATAQALEQSLTLCGARLEQARKLEPGLGRIEAQQEVVYHALASARSALARITAGPTPESLQIDEIRRSAAEVATQTRAVEDAVQEVMSLQAR